MWAVGGPRASTILYPGSSSSPRAAVAPLHRLSWTDGTFISSFAAERDLCADRSSFVLRDEILECVPRHIRKLIEHRGDTAQIEGFAQLFTHLNSDPGPDQLRRLIVTYFQCVPSLRAHLSQ